MNPMAVGGILQGAGSIAGALGLGGSKFKSWHGRENARNEWYNLSGDRESANYYDAVRRGAEKAGFNPLTALGMAPSVGSAAGTLEPPKLASLSMVLDGLTGISDEFTGVASQRRARQELELDIAKLEVEKAKALGGAGIAPAHVSGGPRLGASANKAVATLNGRAITETRNNEREGYTMAGIDIIPNPRWSNAEDAEKRSGDIGSLVQGFLSYPADFGHTARQWANKGFNALADRAHKERKRNSGTFSPFDFNF